MKFFDLQEQYEGIQRETEEAVSRVLASGQYILGPQVEAFESELAHYCGVKHAIGVSSGTDALLVSLMVLGLGPGDEVITSPYTFVATGEAIARMGATPVFVDVGQDFNLDPSKVMNAVTQRTRVIMPVHSFGRRCEMPWVTDAHKMGLVIVEDAAQSIGSGPISGDLYCLSFFPSKNLGACGDGGMVLTNNGGLAEKIRSLRSHGMSKRYYHSVIGGNFRLDELQAAILRIKLRHLDRFTGLRIENAAVYDELFEGTKVMTPSPGVYNQYTVRIPYRDKVRSALSFPTEIYYPCPLHLQECFGYLGYQEGEMPVAEILSAEALSLPIYPEFAEMRQVAKEIISQIALIESS
jgi:dTDP-4-amino-4,6-dideoxygalactose transaminase